MKINNWTLINKRIFGKVKGSYLFEDGEVIATSTIQSVIKKDNKTFINTKSGSRYELGEPSKYATPEQKDLTLINSIEGIEGMDGQE